MQSTSKRMKTQWESMTRKDFVHLLLPLSLTVLYQQAATAGSMDTRI
jgi:hypothetical protein